MKFETQNPTAKLILEIAASKQIQWTQPTLPSSFALNSNTRFNNQTIRFVNRVKDNFDDQLFVIRSGQDWPNQLEGVWIDWFVSFTHPNTAGVSVNVTKWINFYYFDFTIHVSFNTLTQFWLEAPVVNSPFTAIP